MTFRDKQLVSLGDWGVCVFIETPYVEAGCVRLYSPTVGTYVSARADDPGLNPAPELYHDGKWWPLGTLPPYAFPLATVWWDFARSGWCWHMVGQSRPNYSLGFYEDAIRRAEAAVQKVLERKVT